MQDGDSSTRNRMTKRRRIHDVTDDSAEPWDEDESQQQPLPGGGTEGSSWPATNNSSDVYPDLAPYQQQPYFYGQTTSGAGTYNSSSWDTAAAAQAFGDTSTSVSYSVGDQASTTTMPFFPPSTGSNVADSTDALGNNISFNYPDVEHANQYASYTAPSATAQLAQREAAKSSAYYFDDASMHLKIQSLPILDNLVRINNPHETCEVLSLRSTLRGT